MSGHAGQAGTFVGPQEQYLCILNNDSTSLSLYNASKTGAKSLPMYSIDLPGTGAATVHPGPFFQLPPRSAQDMRICRGDSGRAEAA